MPRAVGLHYAVRGDGRPFIMLHGSPGEHERCMIRVEPAFERIRNWKRIYPDLPGHGQSPGSPRIRDMDEYLDAVLQFVDEVTGGGRFCIGGISFGAYFALAVARKRSTRLDGLLLSVPEVSHGPAEERRERAFGTESILDPPAQTPGIPPYREDKAWLEGLPWRDVSLELYRGHRKIRVPALLLFGRQDAPFRAQKYWRLLDDFPRATFAVLDGAAHRLWTDRTSIASALTRDWLERVEANPPFAAPRRSARV